MYFFFFFYFSLQDLYQPVKSRRCLSSPASCCSFSHGPCESAAEDAREPPSAPPAVGFAQRPSGYSASWGAAVSSNHLAKRSAVSGSLTCTKMASERAKRVGYLVPRWSRFVFIRWASPPPLFLLPVQQPGLSAASSLLLNILSWSLERHSSLATLLSVCLIAHSLLQCVGCQ